MKKEYYISVISAAKRFGCTKTHLYNEIRNGKIPLFSKNKPYLVYCPGNIKTLKEWRKLWT